jgi:hypothetical protein
MQPTCLLVFSVRTISSRGMMWAGEKKWAPRMRSWAAVLAPTCSQQAGSVAIPTYDSVVMHWLKCHITFPSVMHKDLLWDEEVRAMAAYQVDVDG